jgi:hypothetical protein
VITRRTFLRSAAAGGAGLLVPFGTRWAGGATGATWTSPASISNTGAIDVSLQLTDWLNTAGSPGDTLKLRRGPGFAPGFYRIERGVAIRRGITLDLNGCWLATGDADGSQHPPVYDDHFDYPGNLWPRTRYCVGAWATGFRLFSSLPNARIQGAARQPHFWNNRYVACEYFRLLEAQHALQVRGYGNEVDLRNIALEFVHGDGVYVYQGSSDTVIYGGRAGLAPLYGQGGILTAENRWQPTLQVYPGIHHVGRQGIAVVNATGTWIQGLSIWQVHRAIVDLEPDGTGYRVDGVIIKDVEAGFRKLMWLAAKGTEPVSNILVEDNISYTKLQIYAKHETEHRRANWTIRRNLGASVFHSPLQCFELRNIDGLTIHDNYQLVSGVRPDMGLALYDCTDVSVVPSTRQQFPVVPT